MNPQQLFVFQILSAVHLRKILLKNKDHEYETRNKNNNTKGRKQIDQRCFTYLAPTIYSVIPKDLKTLRKMKTDKNKLKIG